MVIGIGIDLCSVARVRVQLAAPAHDWREAVFTAAEIAFCEGKPHPARHYAARFAAKEATLKAMARAGASGWFWQDVEVAGDATAGPRIVMRGRLRELADGLGVRRAHVAFSHTRELATATVILEDS